MKFLYLLLSWIFGFQTQEEIPPPSNCRQMEKGAFTTNPSQNTTFRTDGNPDRRLNDVGPIIVIEDTHFKKDSE